MQITYRALVGKFLFTYPNNDGANPTTMSYNASAVKFNNASSSLVRFKNKITASLCTK
jgi:hypothetical protein